MAALQSAYLPEFDHAYLVGLNSYDADIEAHFANHFGRVLHGRIRARLRHGFVEDAVQESLTRVLSAARSPKRIRNPRAFAGFVGAVSQNVVYEIYREGTRMQSLESLVQEPIDQAKGPYAIAKTRQLGERVRETIARLAPSDQKLLCGVYFEEKSRAELCRELGIKRTALRVRLHRAKQQFQDLWNAAERQKPTADRADEQGFGGGRPAAAIGELPRSSRRPQPGRRRKTLRPVPV